MFFIARDVVKVSISDWMVMDFAQMTIKAYVLRLEESAITIPARF